MCGIVGFRDKTGNGRGAVGQTILAMLNALACRGPDSAGVALFGQPADNQLVICVKLGDRGELEPRAGDISRFCGSHGLGHTRLSTESRVDLAIVHNGHITNYHQLRRRYEQRGVRFYTENDSEIIAIYLAEQLGSGLDLESALGGMLRALDGSFSCLAATASHIGFVKDPFALKPLVFAETPDFVAIATEEIAIRAALPGSYEVREAQVKEVRVWPR